MVHQQESGDTGEISKKLFSTSLPAVLDSSTDLTHMLARSYFCPLQVDINLEQIH